MLREAFLWSDVFEKKHPETTSLPVAHMEETAFRIFYPDVAPALLGYIRKACGNAALAEDILQEAFYRFLRADLPEMDFTQKRAYLFKIATSLLVDYWRREKREKLWRKLWKAPETRREEHKGEVSSALSKLKPVDRALLWLAYVEGFDHREIASTLGFKEKSIRVMLFRARKNLAQMLGRQTHNNGVMS